MYVCVRSSIRCPYEQSGTRSPLTAALAKEFLYPGEVALESSGTPSELVHKDLRGLPTLTPPQGGWNVIRPPKPAPHRARTPP